MTPRTGVDLLPASAFQTDEVTQVGGSRESSRTGETDSGFRPHRTARGTAIRKRERLPRRAPADDSKQTEVGWELKICLAGSLGALAIAAIAIAARWTLDEAALAIGLLSVIAASYYGIVGVSLRSNGRSLSLLRGANSTFEVTLASGVLAVLHTFADVDPGVASQAVAVYVVAIAASALRLRTSLCAYATILAAVQYLLVYRLLILGAMAPVAPADAGSLSMPLSLILATGVIATVAVRRARSSLAHSREELRKNRFLEQQLNRFVSRDVANAILTGKAVTDHPERREVTVLFCDLRGFTFLCERERPEDVVELLNTFYERACDIIENQGGTVNKFLGDGLLALFGAPAEHPKHAYAAALAALELQATIRSLRQRGGIWTHLAIGVGLDTGDVVVGPVGGSHRAEYTAIGSPVNRAARLQSLAEHDRQRIILSQATVDALPSFLKTTRLGDVALRGFATSEAVHALCYPRKEAKPRRGRRRPRSLSDD